MLMKNRKITAHAKREQNLFTFDLAQLAEENPLTLSVKINVSDSGINT